MTLLKYTVPYSITLPNYQLSIYKIKLLILLQLYMSKKNCNQANKSHKLTTLD